MSNPVYTTIKNNTPVGRTIRWSKTPVWLPPSGTVDVPNEPWSIADRSQRTVMLASLRNGTVSLVLHLMQTDGSVVDVPYDPSAGVAAPAATPEHITAPQPPEALTPKVVKQDESDHIVRVGSENVAAAGLGLKTEEVKPPASDHNIPKGDETFASQTVAADKAVVVKDELKKAAAAKEEAAAAPADEGKEEDPVRDEFNQMVADKRWEDALKLLVTTYGEDKVTFSVRSIMAIKDYDAVVVKYKLK